MSCWCFFYKEIGTPVGLQIDGTHIGLPQTKPQGTAFSSYAKLFFCLCLKTSSLMMCEKTIVKKTNNFLSHFNGIIINFVFEKMSKNIVKVLMFFVIYYYF